MGKSDDKTIGEIIQGIAERDPELVLKMARDNMKRVLGTDLELWDASKVFKFKRTATGVAIWASVEDVIKLLRDVLIQGCDGFYHIEIFDNEEPNKTNAIEFEDRSGEN